MPLPIFIAFLKLINYYLTAIRGSFLSDFVDLSLPISFDTDLGSINHHAIEDKVNNDSKNENSMQNIWRNIASNLTTWQ